MATERLQIIIDVQNNASRALGSITSNLQSLGRVAGGLALTGVVTLGAAIVGLGAKAVQMGSDASEAMSKFNIVFANTADEVGSSLDQFAADANRSVFALRSMGAEMGDLLQPMGFTEGASADLSVQLVKLTEDLSSFNNIPVEEVFQRIQGGLVGGHENFLRFGVVINESILQQELMRMGAENLTGAQLEQAKVQARINLLFQGTVASQNDAIRTSAGWANQVRGLIATITDLVTEIGLGLLPVVTPLLTRFGEMARQAVPLVKDAIDDLLIPLQFVSDAFVDLLNNRPERFFSNLRIAAFGFGKELGFSVEQLRGFFGALDTVVDALKQARDRFLDFIRPITTSFGQFFALEDILITLGIAIASVVVPAIAGFVVAFAPVVAAIGAVIAAVAILRNIWQNDFLGIRSIIENFIEGTAVPLFERLRDWVMVNLPLAIDFLSQAFAQFTEFMQPAVDAFNNFVGRVLEARNSALSFVEANGGIRGALTELGQILTETAISKFQELKERFVEVRDELTGRFLSAWETLKGIIAGFFEGSTFIQRLNDIRTALIEQAPLITRIKELFVALQPALTVVGTILGGLLLVSLGTINGLFQAFLGSIDELITLLGFFLQATIMVATGFVNVFTGMFEIVIGLVTLNGELIQQGWQKMVDGSGQILQGMFDQFVAIVVDGSALLISLGTEFAEGFAKTFEGFNKVTDAIKGGIDGIAGAIDSLIGWVSDLAEAVANFDFGQLAALIGQSPSPLEIGTRGASRAISDLTNNVVPQLQTAAQRVDNSQTTNVFTLEQNGVSPESAGNAIASFGLLESFAGGA